MIMGSKQNKTGLVFVYHTDDFMNYKLLDEPLHSVPNTDMWEFVDFYPVKTRTHLLHWPVEEIESLRYNGQEFNEIELEPGTIIPLEIGTAT
ncbi:putative 2,1-fructan:2,1-fructan 1-fructosyltransferase [Helianthus annuus]|nr:putative 2,1-fructan:2,1-fructan 1-fructosyltransferase [Helianthus annuus]